MAFITTEYKIFIGRGVNMTFSEFENRLQKKENGNLVYSQYTFGEISNVTIAETVTGSYGVHSPDGTEFFKDIDEALDYAYEVVNLWNI